MVPRSRAIAPPALTTAIVALGFAAIAAGCVVGATSDRPTITEPCDAAGLTVVHEPIEPAAPAPATILTVTNVGPVACQLFGPNVQLRDSSGQFLIAAGPAGSGAIVLEPGGAAATTVRLEGWCEARPAEPVSLGLLLGAAPAAGDVPVVAAGGPFPAIGTIPPCGGPTGTDLAATHWQLP